MKGPRLDEILELIYTENALTQILSGKAVQRALRGHHLLDSCLNEIILENLINSSSEFCSLIEKIEPVYCSVVSGEQPMDILLSMEEIRLAEETLSVSNIIASSSKTSQL